MGKNKQDVDAGQNKKNQHKVTERVYPNAGEANDEDATRQASQSYGSDLSSERDPKKSQTRTQIDSEDQGEINATRNTAGDPGRASRI